MRQLTEEETEIMFHALGYSSSPRWYDNKGGYRNYFCTAENCFQYDVIQNLVRDGLMEYCPASSSFDNYEYYVVTREGIDYVVNLWNERKKKGKPSRSKRRYQAYRDWCDWNCGSFKDFLDWLTVTEEMKLHLPEEVECIKEFKKRWCI